MSRSLTVSVPTDTEIVLRRSFDAPRRLVFAALTTPALLRRWYGARGWQLVECELDLRVGGRWRFRSRGPGGAELLQAGTYRQIQPPGRLVYAETFHGGPLPEASVVSTVLIERAGRTSLTTTVHYPTRRARDIAASSPMERGFSESCARLDALLPELPRSG